MEMKRDQQQPVAAAAPISCTLKHRGRCWRLQAGPANNGQQIFASRTVLGSSVYFVRVLTCCTTGLRFSPSPPVSTVSNSHSAFLSL